MIKGEYIPDIDLDSFSDIAIDQMSGVLSFIPIGIVIAFAILLCEIVWKFSLMSPKLPIIQHFRSKKKNRNSLDRENYFRTRENFPNRKNNFRIIKMRLLINQLNE